MDKCDSEENLLAVAIANKICEKYSKTEICLIMSFLRLILNNIDYHFAQNTYFYSCHPTTEKSTDKKS